MCACRTTSMASLGLARIMKIWVTTCLALPSTLNHPQYYHALVVVVPSATGSRLLNDGIYYFADLRSAVKLIDDRRTKDVLYPVGCHYYHVLIFELKALGVD